VIRNQTEACTGSGWWIPDHGKKSAGGLEIFFISKQEKAKELKIAEKYKADLHLIRKEVEEEIESNVETVFHHAPLPK
jgi:hypothetical protein